MAALHPWAPELLHIWFDELGPDDWFVQSDIVDRMLRLKFGSNWLALSKLPAGDFAASSALAQGAILLFDQIPRNINRDTPDAFASDPLALAIARDFMAKDWDHSLPDEQRQFIAMPLMHSENLADQEASVAYFAAYAQNALPFARKHHEMIARFGRFPHRNAVLGRDTTAEEQVAIDAGFDW